MSLRTKLDHIRLAHRLPFGATVSAQGAQRPSLDELLAAQERDCIVAALHKAGGVQARAAKFLGISERSLWYRLKKLDIDPTVPLPYPRDYADGVAHADGGRTAWHGLG